MNLNASIQNKFIPACLFTGKNLVPSEAGIYYLLWISAGVYPGGNEETRMGMTKGVATIIPAKAGIHLEFLNVNFLKEMKVK